MDESTGRGEEETGLTAVISAVGDGMDGQALAFKRCGLFLVAGGDGGIA